MSLMSRLFRKKYVDMGNIGNTKLKRCLTTFDLTTLGIGSTLGAGAYVVAGEVARNTAGPAVAISFLIAAIASILAGLCYAEFGARFPRTGSAYVYTYITLGEFWAFVIGWNLILEYIIGTSSVARAWSSYFDTLTPNKDITHFFTKHLPMHIPGLAEYPDFFAFTITLLLAVVLSAGVKESTRFNNIFTCINLLVMSYVIITGLFKADLNNWKLEVPEGVEKAGKGGFLPFGVSGLMSGAATCFYAFVGFDAIATTGEECKNPQRAIPISIVISLLTCFVAYFGVSAVITLMCPYYEVDADAPLPQIFDKVGWKFAKYVVAVGAICGLSTSLLGAMFPLPRVLYAMGEDGVIFRFLSKVHPRTQTPVIATLISGFMAAVMATLFDLAALVEMMSIGTLLAYTLVAACVLILRYREASELPGCNTTAMQENVTDSESVLQRPSSLLLMLYPRLYEPNSFTALLVNGLVFTSAVFGAGLGAVVIFARSELSAGTWWAVLLVALLSVCMLGLAVIIFFQPQNSVTLSFTVPGVPWLPIVSMFINIYLMLKLSYATWIRFGVWMFIGFIVYFGYGIRHSTEEYRMLGLLSESQDQDPRASINNSPEATAEEKCEENTDEKTQLLS